MVRSNVTALASVSNDGESVIEMSAPYTSRVTLQGTADYLFHRWSVEAIDTKAKAAKNSAAKKTDDLESFVWRTEDGQLAIPGSHLRGAIINAARFRQDPRSPRKSKMDLYKGGVIVTTLAAPLGVPTWDYEDRQRVTVQRNGITRTRPAMKAGWQATFDVMVMLPEYIDANELREVIEQAGRFCGLGDYRPTYGRFGIVRYEVL